MSKNHFVTHKQTNKQIKKMSKYIYINGAAQGSVPNANIGLVPISEILDFECEFTIAPLQFVVYFGLGNVSANPQQYNLQLDTSVISASDAKVQFDKAFSRTYLSAFEGSQAITEFYPPNGVTITGLV